MLHLIGIPIIDIPITSESEFRILTSQIVATGNLLVREANRLFKPHGISAVQFNVLNLLKEAPGGLRPTALTQALVVDASSTTYVLDRMEALGWICRAEDKDDRRANLIQLTSAGRRMHATVSPLYLAALGEMLRGLDASPLPLMAQSLRGIQAAAQSAVDRVRPAGPVPGRGNCARAKRPVRQS